MIQKKILLTAALFLSSLGFAQELTIYTTDFPPMQYLDADFHVLGGMCVEIVLELQKRIGDTSPIQGVPWTRGYRAVQLEPDVLLFSMARTPEREKLVRWVGPLAVTKSILVARKDGHIRLRNLEDAKRLRSVGIVTDDIRGQQLRAFGFTNLTPTTSGELNVKQVAAGIADVFASTDFNVLPTIKSAGYDPEDFETILVFGETPAYLVFSLKTPYSVVVRWATGLKSMTDDGTLARIVAKYSPE